MLQGATQIPTAAVQTSTPTTPPDNCYQMNILFSFAHFHPLLAPHVELNDHTIFTQVACFHLKLCKLVAYSPNSSRCGYTDPCRILNTLRHCKERFRLCFFLLSASLVVLHAWIERVSQRFINIRKWANCAPSEFASTALQVGVTFVFVSLSTENVLAYVWSHVFVCVWNVNIITS